MSEAGPDAKGTKLQLVVYALAGRLYGPARSPGESRLLVCLRPGRLQHVGYPVTAEVLDRVSETLGQIVRGIEHGVCPDLPDGHGHQPVSSSVPTATPTLWGWSNYRRGLQRKRADPALALFFDLAEPPGPEAADQGNSGQGNGGQGNGGQGNSGQGNSGQGDSGQGDSGEVNAIERDNSERDGPGA